MNRNIHLFLFFLLAGSFAAPTQAAQQSHIEGFHQTVKMLERAYQLEMEEFLRHIDAHLGDVSAQNELGTRYATGKGEKQDYKKAAYWYEQAAKNGNAEAAYNLAVLHEKGKGVEKNLGKALELCEQAAMQDFDPAKEALKRLAKKLAEQQRRAEERYKKAAYWYEQAAKNSNAEAANNLAAFYATDKGVKKNPKKAPAKEALKRLAKADTSSSSSQSSSSMSVTTSSAV